MLENIESYSAAVLLVLGLFMLLMVVARWTDKASLQVSVPPCEPPPQVVLLQFGDGSSGLLGQCWHTRQQPYGSYAHDWTLSRLTGPTELVEAFLATASDVTKACDVRVSWPDGSHAPRQYRRLVITSYQHRVYGTGMLIVENLAGMFSTYEDVAA